MILNTESILNQQSPSIRPAKKKKIEPQILCCFTFICSVVHDGRLVWSFRRVNVRKKLAPCRWRCWRLNQALLDFLFQVLFEFSSGARSPAVSVRRKLTPIGCSERRYVSQPGDAARSPCWPRSHTRVRRGALACFFARLWPGTRSYCGPGKSRGSATTTPPMADGRARVNSESRIQQARRHSGRPGAVTSPPPPATTASRAQPSEPICLQLFSACEPARLPPGTARGALPHTLRACTP